MRPLLIQQPHEEQLATLGQLSEQALAAVTVAKCIEWFQGIRHFIPVSTTRRLPAGTRLNVFLLN